MFTFVDVDVDVQFARNSGISLWRFQLLGHFDAVTLCRCRRRRVGSVDVVVLFHRRPRFFFRSSRSSSSRAGAGASSLETTTTSSSSKQSGRRRRRRARTKSRRCASHHRIVASTCAARSCAFYMYICARVRACVRVVFSRANSCRREEIFVLIFFFWRSRVRTLARLLAIRVDPKRRRRMRERTRERETRSRRLRGSFLFVFARRKTRGSKFFSFFWI